MDRRSFLKMCIVAGASAYFGPPKPKIFSVTYTLDETTALLSQFHRTNKSSISCQWAAQAAEALAKEIDGVILKNILETA